MKTTFLVKSLIAAIFITLAFGSGDSKKETTNNKGNNYNQFTNADFSSLINASGRNSILNFKQTFEYNGIKAPAGFASKRRDSYTVKLDIHSNGTFTYKINQKPSLRGKWNIVQSNSIPDGCLRCTLHLKPRQKGSNIGKVL